MDRDGREHGKSKIDNYSLQITPFFSYNFRRKIVLPCPREDVTTIVQIWFAFTPQVFKLATL
jgi:hypothetical protein